MRLCTPIFVLILGTASVVSQSPVPQTVVDQHIFKVGVDRVQAPHPINNVDASFSPEARSKQVNGRCAVSMTVDIEGNPQDIRIIRCTDPVFAPSTLDAVAKYRFKPATQQDGKPVPVSIFIDVDYKRDAAKEPQLLVNTQLAAPLGALSPEPDANGVYPLAMGVIPPKLIQFSDQGYLNLAFQFPGNSPCDVVLTISSKGKPSNPQAAHCEKPILENLVSQSLLKSRFQPGSFNGSVVPVRVSLHVEFGGVGPTK